MSRINLPTIVGILTFMSRINLVSIELSMKFFFVTSWPVSDFVESAFVVFACFYINAFKV